ncbi:MAG: M30 family zinc metallopeptidase [Spirochaetaceae bacterium]
MMKNILLALSFAMTLSSCNLGPSLDRPAHEVSGPGFRIIHLGENRRSSFSVDLTFERPSDVFVVFTNPTSGTVGLPSLSVSPAAALESLTLAAGPGGENTRVADSIPPPGRLGAFQTAGTSHDSGGATIHRGNARMGVPGLRDLDPDAFEATRTDGVGAAATDDPDTVLRQSDVEASGYAAGSEDDLSVLRQQGSSELSANDFDTVPATVRYVSDPVAGFELVIWVEDALWVDNTGDISQGMVDALGDALTTAPDGGPSVFGTMVATYGAFWGESALSGVLEPDTDTVHVFLADILDAGNNLDSGFVAGYFFARDVFQNETSGSDLPGNNRLMVYVHGPAFAERDGSSWALTDFWPSEMALTTAHELQHLVHYYQARVRTGRPSSEVWLDELLSVLSEELVAERFQAAVAPGEESFLGPRGVPPSVRVPGSDGNPVLNGRLPDFVAYPHRSLTTWSAADVERDYAVSYAFGTWLVRNFGGAGLLPRIYESESSGYEAVEDAVLSHTGESITFGELLERWAASAVMSDRNIPARSYRLTASDWFRSSPGAVGALSAGPAAEFELGDIPLSQYRQAFSDDTDGLYFFSPAEGSQAADDQILSASRHTPHSNIYYRAASAHDGPITLDISADRSGRTSIIILEDR